VSDSNSTEYDVIFTPADTTNYQSAACTVGLNPFRRLRPPRTPTPATRPRPTSLAT
jgi:hypothetical protein